MTQELLKEYFLYIPELGNFAVKKAYGKLRLGDLLKSEDAEGYRNVSFNGKRYYVHRLVWLYNYGEWPSTIDHKNRIRNDNKLENLRDCSRSDNQQNLSANQNNKTGYENISQSARDGTFVIQKTIKGKRMSGSSKTIEGALAIKESMLNGTYDGNFCINKNFKNA